MWIAFLDWMAANHVGDLASVAGLAISVVGFMATLIGVFRSKNAAERAERAAREARDSIRRFDTVLDFADTIAILDGIKLAHREGRWDGMPERYATTRKALIRMRAASGELSPEQVGVIQTALSNLQRLETVVEATLPTGNPLDAPAINSTLSGDIDRLYQVLVELKRSQTGG